MKSGNFSRADFLKWGVFGSSILNCKNNSPNSKLLEKLLLRATKKIIILGGGMAGVACGKALVERGYLNLTILEAANRIGGRIHSIPKESASLDLGAAWIHGFKDNPLTPIARKLNLTTVLTDDANVMAFKEGVGALPEALVDIYENTYESIMDTVSTYTEEDEDEDSSLRDAIETIYPEFFSDPVFSSFIAANEEFDIGGDVSQVSSVYYDDDATFQGGDVVMVEGYSKIVEYLASGLDIRLLHEVSKIQRFGTGFSVHTNRGVFAADAVVCALPLGVLQSGKVVFDPPLSEAKSEAIQSLASGCVNKVFIDYQNPFWDTSKQYINYFSADKGKFSYWINMKTYTPFNMLCGITTGTYSEELEKKTDAAIIRIYHDILKSVYGTSIPEPRGGYVTRWKTSPLSLGAYSFIQVGGSAEDFELSGRMEPPNLHFCGEHTNVDYRGTVHGAYLSGLRVADEIENSVL